MALNYILIAKRIKHYRAVKHISQEELAERADVSSVFISQVETAKKKPSLETLVKIAAALDVTADNLLIGNQKISLNYLEPEIVNILADCSNYEKSVIIDMIAATKKSLRDNKALLIR